MTETDRETAKRAWLYGVGFVVQDPKAKLSMPRTLRIQFPKAFYHIINRGNYRSNIFADDGAILSQNEGRKCIGDTM